ncbi:MAG: ZIP family metal transporter [Bacillota bacterium]
MISEQNLAVSLISGLATGLGGLLASLAGRMGVRAMPALLGLSAGIGFTVVFFDLLPQAVKSGSWALTAGGLLTGLAFGKMARRVFPHLNLTSPHRPGGFIEGGGRGGLQRTAYMFAMGVAMHNLPEGLAIGAGLEAERDLGMLLAAAIGFHNIPEGMALCGIFYMAGHGKAYAVAVPVTAGLMLPLGTLAAGIWTAALPGMLSFILATGAGTLLYIIASEIIPESCRMHPVLARAGMAAGVLYSLAMSAGLRHGV